LIAQAIAFGGFGLYRWSKPKPKPTPTPLPKLHLKEIGIPTHSSRFHSPGYERIALTPKQRFEILKRDGFTCQYCGRKPPEVVLEVDHIIAVYNGGTNDRSNLITSCEPCNRGKGTTPLEKMR